MIMKKFYFILTAAASIALASCTNDEYLGGSPGTGTANENGAIVFGGNAGKLTRATSNTGTVSQMLDGQFKVYGVKIYSGSPNTYYSVFPDYVVWSSNTKTTSNPDVNTAGDRNGWDYVGGTTQTYGADNTYLTKQQYIKYWDYSAENHHFVAGSPVANFTYTITDGEIDYATVTGIKGHITANDGTPGTTTFSPVYIADPVNVAKADYANATNGKEVTFNFTRQQTFVRAGVYETIPGYKITSISFYPYEESSDAWGTTSSNNIILASKTANYFSGSEDATVKVDYDWSTTTPTYTYSYTSGLTQKKSWYGGKLELSTTNPLATTSTEITKTYFYGTDRDMDANGYFTVIPTASGTTAQPILVKCDYTLTAEDASGADVINVKGATAAIPSAFTFWKPNTTYTYLFKISDNTNGTTGNPGEDPEGLFPITFDAVVTAEADGMAQGIITTVTTPSITTYQVGSVTNDGVKYVKDKAIYVTAQNDETGALTTLQSGGSAVGAVQIYSLGTTAKTEADLILTRPTGTNLFGLGSAAATVGTVSFEANKYGSFTPTAAGYYAIEYQTATSPAAYAYKIVYVED